MKRRTLFTFLNFTLLQILSMSKSLAVIVLAAGKGTRMKSSRAKVLHQVFFSPMLHHVLSGVAPLSPSHTIVVTGHQREEVESCLSDYNITPVLQENQLGTGHAVLSTTSALSSYKGTVMILCGDTPLIRTETLKKMVGVHTLSNSALTLLTTKLADPTNYGRILRNSEGNLEAIVEQKDCTESQTEIQEINAGIYCVESDFLFSALQRITNNNSQGELYLTDIISIGVRDGFNIQTCSAPDPQEVLGVNSRVELAEAEAELQRRHNRVLMLQGVSMIQPDSIRTSPHVKIGQDSILEPQVQLLDSTRIGNSCRIGQGAILKNCILGDNVSISPYVCLTDVTIHDDSSVSTNSTYTIA